MTTTQYLPPMGMIRLPGRLESALPLRNTQVNVKILGGLTSVQVRQQFQNPLNGQAELEYLFPLPEDAAVTGFRLRAGERVIRSVLQESGQARGTFEEARRTGRRAGLLEMRRPNLFSVQLTQLRGGEEIETQITYIDRLELREDGYEFVFPMGLTPKYDRAAYPEEGSGTRAPFTLSRELVGRVSIEVMAELGVSCADPLSPSHALSVQRESATRLKISLKNEEIPDRDFVLRLPCLSGTSLSAVWTTIKSPEGWLVGSILPPREDADTQPPPREFVFVLDRSGSMGGLPILQAKNALKACLRTLNQQDTFRIQVFDHVVEWLSSEPCRAAQAEVWQADAQLDRVDARGGTEIADALKAALSLAVDPRRQRYVVFLTDGAVSAEEEVIHTMLRLRRGARIFTFGIGSSVNRALLRQIARLGQGASEFLQNEEEIEESLIRFQNRISFPALQDLRLSWSQGMPAQILPDPLPDLYYGQALSISGRLGTPPGAKTEMRLSGTAAGHAVNTVCQVLPIPALFEDMGALFAARDQIEAWEDETRLTKKTRDLEEKITRLAMSHGLATAYTSLVAVDEAPGGVSGSPVKIDVALPLPRGGEIDGGYASQAFIAPPGAPAYKTLRSRSFGMADHSMLQSDSDRQAIAVPVMEDKESKLRRLARRQRMNGSWDEDVEMTCAAVLAFLRLGHSPTAGSFRPALRKALAWLRTQHPEGFISLLYRRVLEEAGAASALPPMDNAELALARDWADPERLKQSGNGLDLLRAAVWQRQKVSLPIQHSSGLAELYGLILE